MYKNINSVINATFVVLVCLWMAMLAQMRKQFLKSSSGTLAMMKLLVGSTFATMQLL